SLDWQTTMSLINLIVNIEDKFDDNVGVFTFGISNPKSHAAITIYRLIKSHNDINEQYNLAQKLISDAPFNFSMEILRWLKAEKNNPLFAPEQYIKLEGILLQRALRDCEQSES